MKFSKKIHTFKNKKSCQIWLNANIDKSIQRRAYLYYYNFCKKYNIKKKYIELQFKGYWMDYQMDIGKDKQLKSVKQLIRYCFCVAGSVAILLTHTVQDSVEITPELLFGMSAIGVGFQLTNIARDIITDAKIKRVYIPGITTKHKKLLLNNKLDNGIILSYAKKTIEMAETYYHVGIPMLNKLPKSVSKGLHICTIIYRQIGLNIYKSKTYPERMSTSMLFKIYAALMQKHHPFLTQKDIIINYQNWL